MKYTTEEAYEILKGLGMPDVPGISYKGAGFNSGKLIIIGAGTSVTWPIRDILTMHALRWLRLEASDGVAGNAWLNICMPLFGGNSFHVFRERQTTALDMEAEGEDLLDTIVDAWKAIA